jgi:hypothetical protein
MPPVHSPIPPARFRLSFGIAFPGVELDRCATFYAPTTKLPIASSTTHSSAHHAILDGQRSRAFHGGSFGRFEEITHLVEKAFGLNRQKTACMDASKLRSPKFNHQLVGRLSRKIRTTSIALVFAVPEQQPLSLAR